MAFKQKEKMSGADFARQVVAKIAQIDYLCALRSSSPQFSSWRKSTEELIRDFLGDGRELEEFNSIFYSPLFLSCSMDDKSFDEAYKKGLEEARTILKKIGERLKAKG